MKENFDIFERRRQEKDQEETLAEEELLEKEREKEMLQEPSEKPPEISEKEIFQRAISFTEEGGGLQDIDQKKARIIIDKIDDMPVYERYKNRKFSLEKLSEEISEIEKNASNDQLREILSFLKEEIEDIRASNHRYTRLVRGFERSMKIENFRLDQDKKQKKIENYDQSRKNCHNKLLSSFQILKRHIKETLPQKFNIHLSEDILFSDEQLADRDYIGDWARLTATGEELENYREKLIAIAEKKDEIAA